MSSSDLASRKEIDPAEKLFFARVQSLLLKKERSRKKEEQQSAFNKGLKICGVDASYRDDKVVSTAVLLSSKGEVQESFSYQGSFTFPYISGLFFLHEGPFVVFAVLGLRERPDLVCFDAHGLAHPRHLGLATICGEVLDIPSIGIAKSKLVGEVSPSPQALQRIMFETKQVGYYVITGGRKRYWSPGHAVSLQLLERIIERYATICLKSLEEAHRLCGMQIRTLRKA